MSGSCPRRTLLGGQILADHKVLILDSEAGSVASAATIKKVCLPLAAAKSPVKMALHCHCTR